MAAGSTGRESVGRPLTPDERDEARIDTLTDHLSGSGHEYAYARAVGFLPDELYAVERLHNELHERGDLATRHIRRDLRAEV